MKKAVFNNKGFTLIELLIVCAMLGIIMGAIFTLYQTHQRSAYTQEEVVEVQQNLRIAIDSITRDIKMAGFFTPLPQTVTAPLNAATGGSITINTGSEGGKYARITSNNQTVTLALNDTINLSVDSVDNFDSNDVNDSVVRIIRPQDNNQAVTPVTFTVTGVRASLACGLAAAPCLILQARDVGSGSINSSDMIVRTGTTTSETYPNTIQYAYSAGAVGTTCSSNCLTRAVNGAATGDVIANNITNLQFSYILDTGAETAAPADLSTIRAVRVTITGQTVTTIALSGGQAKTRQIASIVRIRNRR